MNDNFFSLLCITLLINQKRARLRNVNTPPFMIKHASLHKAHHGSRKQHTRLSIEIILKNTNRGKAGKWAPVRPMAREMTQHEGRLTGWRRVTQPAEIWICDGRFMSPSLTVGQYTACPGLELLSCELLPNPAALSDVVLVLNVHKTPPWALSGQGRHGSNSSWSLPCCLSGEQCQNGGR